MYEIVDTSQRDRLLYFAQSDSHLRTFMPQQSSFRSDLATRLMLEPGVVILDSLFITSEEIESDLEKLNRSLTWHGLKRELIVPAFRENGVDSFEENYRLGIIPTTSIGIRKNAPKIVSQLDAAIKGTRAPKITWPDGIGTSFGELINEQFTRESIDGIGWGNKEKELWKQSHDLRNRYLDLAWQREPNPKETGLRRSTIFTAIAADLGFAGDPLDTAGIIGSTDKRRQAALRATLLWVDELYNYNQASRFEIKPSFPVSKCSGAQMLPHLLWPGDDRASGTSEIEVRSQTIPWPSRRKLSNVSPDILMGLRTDEYGQAYIARLNEFREDPSEVNWQDLRFTAQAYAEKVCKTVGSEVQSGMQISHLIAPNGITIALALAAAATGGLALAGVGAAAIICLISTAIGSVYIPVNDITKKDRNKDGKLTMTATGGKQGEIRMDLPTR